jgi:uncharacterized protein (DUF433 family)
MVIDILDRITYNTQVMGGKATIRSLRISVSFVVNLVASGISISDILNEYPYLEEDDIRQALLYASALINDDYPLEAYS